MMKRRFEKLKEEKGQSIVEFAIILPVLLLVLCGIIDFGWIYSNELSLNNCTREGARYGSIHAGEANAEEMITNRILDVSTDSLKKDMTIEVSFTNTTDPTAGDVIITVESRIDILTPIVGVFFDNQQVELSSTVTMKAE